jgi:hypothetical protein
MAFDTAKLNAIFAKTNGHCHICHKKLCRNNYGLRGRRGAWEVEHSHAQANGGSDHLNNLLPACIRCNRDKGTFTTRTARAWNGQTRAPLSAERKNSIRTKYTAAGAVLGAISLAAAGPAGLFWGALIGGAVGRATAPDK